MATAEHRSRSSSFRGALYAHVHACGATRSSSSADAVLCAAGPVASVPSLSLRAGVHAGATAASTRRSRRVGSTRTRSASLLVAHRPADWPMVFAVDASTFDRCDAECSPERGFYYSASKHSAGQPIVAGLALPVDLPALVGSRQLDRTARRHAHPADRGPDRPPPSPSSAASSDCSRTTARCRCSCFDAGYDPIAIGHDLADARCEVLCRIRDDRVFYGDAPPRPNRPPESGGRPPRHGRRWKCSDPKSWPEPSASLVASDPRYGTITVTAWHGMHPRLLGRGHWSGSTVPPIVRGSVIRVDVEHLPKPTSRAKKTLWLWWSGDGEPDLDRCWRAYLRRFDIEHTFRFVKQTLGWTTPSALHARAGRPLDLAHRRRAHRAPTRPRPRRRSPPALGATARPVTAHAVPGADGGFGDFVQRSALRPVHRNPRRPDQDARKGPENPREPAIRRSKRPPEQAVKV